MTLNADTTVRELALGMPQATRIFERLKIDYCCGGARPLGAACADAGLDVATVMQQLAEAGAITQSDAQTNFQTVSLTELIAHIIAKHHVYTKEEMVLFPYIKGLEEAHERGGALMRPPFGTINNPVRMMMYEHDAAGALLRELRAAANDYLVPADACLSYRTLYEALTAFEQDLHQHIHLENNVLFPRAVELESKLAG